MNRFLTDSQEDIERASNLLQSGEVVAIPTETVYGLAANAFDEQAVARIFEIKGRPLIDPLIVHVAGFEQAEKLAICDSELIQAVSRAFWPGPLTVILKKQACVPDLVTAGKDTVAIRMPGHPLAHQILAACQLPLAAPSANPFGYVSPTRPEHVRDSFGTKVSHIVDGGPCQNGLESTILDISNESEAIIRRPGPITKEILREKLGVDVEFVRAQHSADETKSMVSPGSLKKHYSPQTRLKLVEKDNLHTIVGDAQKVAYVSCRRSAKFENIAKDCDRFWLSESGDLKEIGRNVFDLIRQLDRLPFDLILIEKAENEGLGITINDRLTRAAAQ